MRKQMPPDPRRVAYWCCDYATGKSRTVARARVVWRQYYGPIPKGYHIHHKDFNPGNDAIDNLECLSPGEHRSRHPQNRSVRTCECGERYFFEGERLCAEC